MKYELSMIAVSKSVLCMRNVGNVRKIMTILIINRSFGLWHVNFSNARSIIRLKEQYCLKE